MLNTFVVGRLNLWAEWRQRRNDHGMGFPKKVSFMRDAPQTCGFWSPEMDSAAYEVEQCVLALIPERKAVVMQEFTKVGTREQKAKACGCAVNTYKSRLDFAYQDILGLLNDLAAGIAINRAPSEAAQQLIANKVALTA